MDPHLNGKYVLITGSAGLLGPQHAAAIAKIGGNLVLSDIHIERLVDIKNDINKKYPKIKVIIETIDVTNEDNIKRVSDSLTENGVRIQVLINNAAHNPIVGGKLGAANLSRLEDLPLKLWRQDIDVGLTGAFLMSKEFGTKMARGGNGGVIVNVASDLSVIAPDQRIYQSDMLSSDEQFVKPVTYSVVKTGLVGMTRYLSTYWADKGIRVNALSPGGVENGQDPLFIERIKKLIPLGRMAEISEYQAAIQFLSSDSSSYMTGQNLILDGGRSVW